MSSGDEATSTSWDDARDYLRHLRNVGATRVRVVANGVGDVAVGVPTDVAEVDSEESLFLVQIEVLLSFLWGVGR